MADSKQHEKDYLQRSGGGDWEASKPFPASGQLATDEHAQHLLDFAVLLRVLKPDSHDLVLDLGAGSCWVSDWLRRCGVRTVAVDIAVDMLRLGITRLGGAHGIAAGDMEALPFGDGVFSKACCLNAFHHVPNAPAALREIRRVLAPNGIAFFSEPGAGHASHPTSIAAAHNYGVLEQEILIDDFMEACRVAGFADVRLHPISHVVPLFVLEKNDWKHWRSYTASTRPMRALEKAWRAALELFGARKTDALFEEAFAIRLLRELQPIIEQHPVITAHCAPFVRPTRSVEAAALQLLETPANAPAGGAIGLRLRLKNVGTTRWEHQGGSGHVRLGVQLLGSDGAVLDRDFARQELPATIEPGNECEVALRVAAPTSPGTYTLKFDLVREGVTWFELVGSQTISSKCKVQSAK